MKSQGRHFLNNAEGKGVVGCLIFIVLLGAAIFVTIQLGPVYYANYAMESELKKEASKAGARVLDDEEIVKEVLNLAKRNEVPLKEENVKISRLAGQVHIEINYTVPVDFAIIQRDFIFNLKASSFIGAL